MNFFGKVGQRVSHFFEKTPKQPPSPPSNAPALPPTINPITAAEPKDEPAEGKDKLPPYRKGDSLDCWSPYYQRPVYVPLVLPEILKIKTDAEGKPVFDENGESIIIVAKAALNPATPKPQPKQPLPSIPAVPQIPRSNHANQFTTEAEKAALKQAALQSFANALESGNVERLVQIQQILVADVKEGALVRIEYTEKALANLLQRSDIPSSDRETIQGVLEESLKLYKIVLAECEAEFCSPTLKER